MTGFNADGSNREDPDDRVAALFAGEVPEIASGRVVIRALAREPGVRIKVVVDAGDEVDLDPIGVCIGPEATRVRTISAALGGESIHVLHWSSDPETAVRRALAPLAVARVELDRQSGRAIATVPRSQRREVLDSIEGQSKLASRLTGWDIEIVLERDDS